MRQRKLLASTLVFLGVLGVGSFADWSVAHATPPASPYAPGETLAPSCNPGDTNCDVEAPVTDGSNLGSGTGVFGQTASGIMQFKSLGAGSSKLSLSSDATSVSFDVNEANLNLANLGGLLDIAHGGTGAITAGAAFAALAPSQTLNAGKFLTTDGTTASWGSAPAAAWGTITGVLTNQTDLSTALSGKEPSIAAGTTGQYWRGDKSWQTLNASAVGLGNVENTALSTWAGSTNLTTLGTIASGTWNGTAVDIAHGGTGAITAGAAFNALSPMSNPGDLIYGGTSGAGTRLAGNASVTRKFLLDDGDGMNASAPAWTTLTSADVGLGNVENTALSTWAGSTNLTTLGTIASGTWNGTAVAIAHGGTGAITAGAAFAALAPSQTLNAGKFLTTDGTTASWGSAPASAWGAITGALSSQTDLQNALNLKAPLSSPTFTGTVVLPTGTSSAAPLMLASGLDLTTPAAGAVEWDGTNLFVTQTTGPTRKTIAYADGNITGTAANVTGTVAVANGGTGAITAGAALTALGGTPSTRQVIAGTGLSGGGNLSADITLSLPNIGTAGTYGDASNYPVITTDAQGRITGVTAQALPAAGGIQYPALDVDTLANWKLDEAAGATTFVNAASPGTYDLGKTGTPVSGVISMYGFGVRFPGSSVNYFLDGATTLEPAHVSARVWFKPTAFTSNGDLIYKMYYVNGAHTSPYLAIGVSEHGSGTLSFYMSSGGVFSSAASAACLDQSEWNLVSLTFDGTTLTGYCNGVSVVTITPGGAIDYGTHGPWTVGGGFTTDNSVNGMIDDVRIDDIARNLSYWQTAYRDGKGYLAP